MNVDNLHYNKDSLFSYNEFLNFSISERGLGKTTCAKFWCIDDFIKTGHRFVWVRRYNSELAGDPKQKIEGCVKTFFDKLSIYYPKHKFAIKGNHAYIDDKDAGVFVALSMSQSMKSVDFPNVNKIVFDEFIIKVTKATGYLKDEVTLFLDLVSTVLRPMTDENGKEKLKGKVWLLSNAITFANEYFFYFNIKPFHKRFYHDKKRGIVVEQCENKIYRDAVRKSAFGKLISGTAYEKFAVDNEYMLDTNDFIGKKSPQADFIFNVRYEGHEWGIYADYNFVYITFNVDRERPFYVFSKKDHTLDSMLIKSIAGTRFEQLVRNYQMGFIRFESIMIKNKFIDFMKLFIVK